MDGLAFAAFLLAGFAGDDSSARTYWNCGSMVIPMAYREERDVALRGQRAAPRGPQGPQRRPEPRRRSSPCFRLAAA